MSDRPSEARSRPVTDDVVEQEIKHEQAVVDRIYARLEAAADSARALAADGHARARLGNEGGLVERDAIVFQASKRLADPRTLRTRVSSSAASTCATDATRATSAGSACATRTARSC